ncbi:predicted protein [Pediculus humanus corporis]|uniref:Predicted protein n=1 Tax=Pediculus humanus subsp. corporis TaxID=121224 RepID=E0VIL2_PEDHC|nr:uncharacterized protein Phum_PHUM228750 [Pediculus humanus corporis]EEB13218.1 predicted protein [Pediculus humanus corporis]
MSEIKIVELDDQLQTELTIAGEKLVVVYYSAEWCVPCKKIKPFYEELSKKHPSVVFLKLDVDICQETAIAQGVTAMPTFIFHKNLEKIDVLQGADPLALEQKITQYSKNREENLAGYSDLQTYISMNQCECMNESDRHPFRNVFENNDSYLESDCDAQLIMAVTFQQPVKIHSIKIKAPQTNGPKNIKIFINQPHTLGFDSGESNVPVQELIILPTQLDNTPIPLTFVKFQNVTNIQLYVQNNQNSSDKTVLNSLGFIGIPKAATNMGDFQRVSGKKGEIC